MKWLIIAGGTIFRIRLVVLRYQLIEPDIDLHADLSLARQLAMDLGRYVLASQPKGGNIDTPLNLARLLFAVSRRSHPVLSHTSGYSLASYPGAYCRLIRSLYFAPPMPIIELV
jgi:hypothetical protein